MESTEVSYELTVASEVEISLYDLRGSHVTTVQKGFQSPGRHKYSISGLEAGTYMVRMVAGNRVTNHRLVKIN
jgi:hypothetical protein